MKTEEKQFEVRGKSQVIFRIDPELHSQFRIETARNRESMTSALINMIEKYVIKSQKEKK